LAVAWWDERSGPDHAWSGRVGYALLIVAQLLTIWMVIALIMQTSYLRAIAVWFSSIVPSLLIMGSLFLLVIRPYVFEAFVVSSNSMAPTMVGPHRSAVCPHCKGQLIVPGPDPDASNLQPMFGFTTGICTSCFRTADVPIPRTGVNASDRILVNK